MKLAGFGGLLRGAPGADERLGRELADQARATGLKGLLHSDELPAYGVTDLHVERLRAVLAAGTADAFVVVTAPDPERAEAALLAVAARASAALEGVPGETRDPLPDGRTRYSRPLPGRERMYPETDLAPIPITAPHLARLAAHLPERPAALRERLVRETGLAPELVRQLVAADRAETLEELVRRGRNPALAARLLVQEIPALPRPEGAPEREFPVAVLDALLRGPEEGRFAKEGLAPVLAELARGAPDLEAAIARAGLSGLSAEALSALVDRVVAANAPLVRDRGDAAFSALMGDVMREVRGRRDGQEVAAALRRAIATVRADPAA